MGALSLDLSELAGQFRVVPSTVSVGPAPPATVLAVANPLRWALLIGLSAGAGAQITLLPSPAVASGQGLYLAGPGNLLFNFRDWGGLTQQQWYASADVVHPLLVSIVEVIAQQ